MCARRAFRIEIDMNQNDFTSAYTAPHPLLPDLDEVRTALEAMMRPGDVHELCTIRSDKGYRGKPQIDVAYVASPEKAAELVSRYTFRTATACYVGLNPVDQALHSRYHDRFEEAASLRTKDGDVVCYRNLLVDVDPVRPVGVSATDAELAAAGGITTSIAAYLTEEGWPLPVIEGTSGNGGQLIYRLPDLPNNHESTAVVRRVLNSLAALFDTDAVKVDTGVFNTSRITKIPGTAACKGDHTKDRPWRKAKAVCRG